MTMNETESLIVHPILAAHPRTQAIYLYGTWGTKHQHPDSEINLAVLSGWSGNALPRASRALLRLTMPTWSICGSRIWTPASKFCALAE